MNYDEYIKTTYQIGVRDGNRCVITGAMNDLERYPHHCFYKSEYFGKDRDKVWNRVTIAREPHHMIHFGWGKKRKEFDERCKQIALARYRGKNRERLEAIMKQKNYSFNGG